MLLTITLILKLCNYIFECVYNHSVNYHHTTNSTLHPEGNHTVGWVISGTRQLIAEYKRRLLSVGQHKGIKEHGRVELDLHADTTVAGSNCVVLSFTGRECEVSPYTDAYESVKNVPTMKAATGYTLKYTGQN
jgi:hypothetical protein